MKLRMEKGVVKIRLAPSEIEELNGAKALNEKIFLSEENQFMFSLKIEKSLKVCTIKFKQYSLNIGIPGQKVEKWINSNQIGIKETIITDNADEIVLTLEEDLPPRKHKKSN